MREQFEKLPEIRAILKKGVFEYTDFTKSYNFIDAMTCINARPSQHKDHGYLNGAWRTYQEQQKKIDEIVGIVREADLSDGDSSVAIVHDEIQELLK